MDDSKPACLIDGVDREIGRAALTNFRDDRGRHDQLVARHSQQVKGRTMHRIISGEALTTGGSGTVQLLVEAIHINWEGIHVALGQDQQKIGPVEPGDLPALSWEIWPRLYQ